MCYKKAACCKEQTICQLIKYELLHRQWTHLLNLKWPNFHILTSGITYLSLILISVTSDVSHVIFSHDTTRFVLTASYLNVLLNTNVIDKLLSYNEMTKLFMYNWNFIPIHPVYLYLLYITYCYIKGKQKRLPKFINCIDITSVEHIFYDWLCIKNLHMLV